jgi:hypothetical protein
MFKQYTRTKEERNAIRNHTVSGNENAYEQLRTCMIARLIAKYGSKRIWRYAKLADSIISKLKEKNKQ